MNLSAEVLKALHPGLADVETDESGMAYSPSTHRLFNTTLWVNVGQLSDDHKISTEYNDIAGMWYASNGDHGMWHEDQKTAIVLCFLLMKGVELCESYY